MAISIDRVYQKVLAFANKEQRGYITPQEFNLFADQAQMEILEQYFYDINQWSRQHGNDTEYSDMLNLLDEKLGVLKKVMDFTPINGFISRTSTGFDDIYKIGSLFTNLKVYSEISPPQVEIEEVNANELLYINLGPLTQPTASRPIYISRTDGLYIYPAPELDLKVHITYTKTPTSPNWNYVVVNDKALYNSTASTDFELHASEESELVYRILAYAGIAIEKPQLTQMAAGFEQAKVQQEKK